MGRAVKVGGEKEAPDGEEKRPDIVYYGLPHSVKRPGSDAVHHYDGWAPHVHTEEEKIAFASWQAENFSGERYQPPYKPWNGGLMEMLLWDLADAGIEFSYAVDQWAAVMTEGKIGEEIWTTYVQGDSIALALMETHRWWFKEKGIDRGGPTLG